MLQPYQSNPTPAGSSMIYRAHLAVVALCFAFTFTPSAAKAQPAPLFLIDLENLEITPTDQRAIALRKPTQAEKLTLPAKYKQAKQNDLAFLRCETPHTLNKFGEADHTTFGSSFPENLPNFENLFAQKSTDAPDMVRVRAWRGVAGLLHMDAGYGFFSLLQYYLPGQKVALLGEMKLAGWQESNETVAGANSVASATEKVHIFKKATQTGPVLREIHVFERQIFTDLKFARRPGLTLACVSKVKK